MSRHLTSDLVVNTKDHCFFCLEKVSSNFPSVGAVSSVYSIQYLSRHLGLDTKKVFIHAESIPYRLQTTVERSNLKVQLCEECVKLNTTFSKLGKKLEKIVAEVDFQLNLIHDKLAATENPQFCKFAEGSSEGDVRKKLEIADVLRAETVIKCTRKIGKFCHKPRVKIQTLTQKEVLNQMLWLRSKSEKLPNEKVTDHFEPVEPPQLKMKMAEIKVETQIAFDSSDEDEHNNLNDWEEQPEHSHSLTLTPILKSKAPKWPPLQEVDGKYKCDSCDKIFQNTGSYNRHYKSFHLGVSFFCRVCNRKFKQKYDLTRHQQATICRTGQAPKPKKPTCHCSICGKGFTFKWNLSNHLKEVHSQLRNHRCDLCEKQFKRKRNLKQHQDTVHAKLKLNEVTIAVTT